jgi:starch synthase
MNVLFVTSEVATLYKRGGLADVSYSLPVALARKGIKVAIAMPYFQNIKAHPVHCVGQLAIDYDRRRELMFIFETLLPGTNVPVYLFRHPLLNDYDGPDIVERFGFFAKAVAQLYLYSSEMLGGPYDIVHCNDWHTALIPLLLGESSKVGFRERETIQSKQTKTILTVHNLLYQGEASSSITLKLGFPKPLFHAFMTPLGRAIRLLTEGFEYVDSVTTVSPTYAKEIMRGDHGKRVCEVFARRGDRIEGILNGIDTDLWNPRTDMALPVQYTTKTVASAKQTLKEKLQMVAQLPQVDVPLFGFVGRFEARQKGLDLIARAVDKLPKNGYQMVLLGTGQPKLVKQFQELARTHKNIAYINTFDERLARRIYAGSDVMLVPSRFEPCGLTQMIAMRYGTLPLVRKTGGLADSVQDGMTGFVFGPYTTKALIEKMREAMKVYREQPKRFASMMKAAMMEDFSWAHQVKEYIALYKKLLGK